MVRPRSPNTPSRTDNADNLNELLLLTIQSVCNSNSVKIPWSKVAETMGHNASEGAIVQHLAKLRSRRIQADKAVPPALRRGGGKKSDLGTNTAGSTKVGSGASANKVTKAMPAKPKRTRGPRGRKTKQEFDSNESEGGVLELDSDSEGEYGKRRQGNKGPKRTVARQSKLETPSDEDGESEEEDSEPTGDEEEDGELLAAGAKFLDYPNYVESDPATPAAEPSPKKSKVIVLKYRSNKDKKPSELQSTAHPVHEFASYPPRTNEDEMPSESQSAALPMHEFDYPPNWLNPSHEGPFHGYTGPDVGGVQDHLDPHFMASGQQMLGYNMSADTLTPALGEYTHADAEHAAELYPTDSFGELLDSYTEYQDDSYAGPIPEVLEQQYLSFEGRKDGQY